MLYPAPGGAARVALGSKDGLLYGIDRASHEPVFRTPVTTRLNVDSQPTAKGVHACPGPMGGVEWNGPTYDPKSGMIYAGAVDWCGVYTTELAKRVPYTPGQMYAGTSYAPAPIVGGVTPTAGGVVFNGDVHGNLYAFDATSGTVLYKYNTGGGLAGGVVTYARGGRQ